MASPVTTSLIIMMSLSLTQAQAALSCPENTVYKACGCQPSCVDRVKEPDCPDCQEGCFCRRGLFWDGDNCIEPRMCGCYVNGTRYAPTESTLTADCSQSCYCRWNSPNMRCRPSDCPLNSICTIDNGERVCVCPPNTVLENGVCVPGGFDDSTSSKEDFPCEAAPSNCVAVQGPCVGTRINQICGVGVMTEQRTCYETDAHTGPSELNVVNRRCCIRKCTKDDFNNSNGSPPDITCNDVFPYCEEETTP